MLAKYLDKTWPVVVVIVFASFPAFISTGCTAGKRSLDLARIRTLVLYEPLKDGTREIWTCSLEGAPSMSLDEETTKRIFANTEHHCDWVLWKGGSLGVATLEDRTTVRIAVSHYGGFFRILGEKGYYVTRGESRKALEEAHYKALHEVFIPWRREFHGSPGTVAKRLEDFSDYYATVRRAPAEGDRISLARRISRSNLTFAQKAWLLYELVDPEQSFQEVKSVAGCPAEGFGMVQGWIRVDVFTNGLIVSSLDIDGSQRSVTLGVEINSEHPEGHSVGLGIPVRWFRSEDVRSRESDPDEEGPDAAAPRESFCDLYARCISAAEAQERVELGEFVRSSAFSESEKAWLLFNLTRFGIPAEEAHRILGGDRSLEKSWQEFIADMPTERPIDLRSYKPTGVYRPARYYSWGISVFLSEDERHVEFIRLGLKKTAADVMHPEDIPWSEWFPADDVNSQEHPLPPEPKPDE